MAAYGLLLEVGLGKLGWLLTFVNEQMVIAQLELWLAELVTLTGASSAWRAKWNSDLNVQKFGCVLIITKS